MNGANYAHTKSELALCQRKGYTMNTNTNNTKPTTTKRPAVYTKYDWESKTLRVYTGLVKLVKNEITLAQFVNHPVVKELAENCEITKGMDDKTAVKTRGWLTVNLIITMTKDRTHDHEKERHVAPIYRLRAFFNGEWKEFANRPVTYSEPKAPKAPAKKASPKGKKSEVKKVKNVSVEQWVNNLSDDNYDLLKVAIAMRDLELAS